MFAQVAWWDAQGALGLAVVVSEVEVVAVSGLLVVATIYWLWRSCCPRVSAPSCRGVVTAVEAVSPVREIPGFPVPLARRRR